MRSTRTRYAAARGLWVPCTVILSVSWSRKRRAVPELEAVDFEPLEGIGGRGEEASSRRVVLAAVVTWTQNIGLGS